MGVEYSIHLGPYVECDVETASEQRTRKVCPNLQCLGYPVSDAATFCGRCGVGLVPQVYELRVRKVDGEDVRASMRDAMFIVRIGFVSSGNAVDIWLPNRRRPEGSRDTDIGDGEPQAVPIDAGDIVSEAQAFLRDYAGPIAAIEAAYGAGKVRVKWGMVRWAS